jgi:mercuric ion transport protein
MRESMDLGGLEPANAKLNCSDGSPRYHIGMSDRKFVTTGIIGVVVAALCCFTPLLVVLLTAVGLSAVIGKLDYVLLPAMAIFLAILAYGLVRQRKA